MSALRVRTPDGVVADVDLGPSGHTRNGTGFVFHLLSEQPTQADRAKWKAPKPPSPGRYGHRVTTNRCAMVMQDGGICARKAGHSPSSGHKSRAAMDRALASYRL